jgi:hypothetical protein
MMNYRQAIEMTDERVDRRSDEENKLAEVIGRMDQIN